MEFGYEDYAITFLNRSADPVGKYRWTEDGRLLLFSMNIHSPVSVIDIELTQDRLVIKNERLIERLMDNEVRKRTGYIPEALDFQRFDPRND